MGSAIDLLSPIYNQFIRENFTFLSCFLGQLLNGWLAGPHCQSACGVPVWNQTVAWSTPRCVTLLSVFCVTIDKRTVDYRMPLISRTHKRNALPPCAKDKNEWRNTPTPPICLHGFNKENLALYSEINVSIIS